MKEVKTPKKPLAYYYGIVLIVLIVFNLVAESFSTGPEDHDHPAYLRCTRLHYAG